MRGGRTGFAETSAGMAVPAKSREDQLGSREKEGVRERVRTDVVGGVALDDALGDSLDGVTTAVERCLEEVVGRLLEGSQHENRVLHLGDSESSDTEDLALGATNGIS